MTEPTEPTTEVQADAPRVTHKAVSEVLAFWRMHAGLTQAEVSALTGCHRSSISHFENGRLAPPASYILLLGLEAKRYPRVIERVILANALGANVAVADLEPPAEPIAKDTEVTLALLALRRRLLAGTPLSVALVIYDRQVGETWLHSIGPDVELLGMLAMATDAAKRPPQ